MKKIISTMLCAALLTAAIFTIGCTDKDKENETNPTEPVNTTETSSTDPSVTSATDPVTPGESTGN